MLCVSSSHRSAARARVPCVSAFLLLSMVSAWLSRSRARDPRASARNYCWSACARSPNRQRTEGDTVAHARAWAGTLWSSPFTFHSHARALCLGSRAWQIYEWTLLTPAAMICVFIHKSSFWRVWLITVVFVDDRAAVDSHITLIHLLLNNWEYFK